MKIGIDGNQWYCSNGLCLGDPRANYTFARTLRDAITAFQTEFKSNDSCPAVLHDCLDMTPEEFTAAGKNEIGPSIEGT